MQAEITNNNFKSTRGLMILIVFTLFSISAFSINDTIAPNIIYSSPSGYLNQGNILLNVITDETSICNYDTTNVSFELMSDSFIENNTNHEKSLTLSDGSYNYYVACEDSSNNTGNTKQISFSIDTSNPNIISLEPTSTITNTYLTLKIVTNEISICRYDTSSKLYESMNNLFLDTNSTLHEQDIFDLSAGDKTYFVGCKDKSGNVVYDSTSFKIILPPTFTISIDNKPPIKEGTHKIDVYSSKRLINPPTLKYKFDDEAKEYDSSLIGDNNHWTGYIIIPEYPIDRVGKFIISGKDHDGLTGSEIKSGKLFLVDTVKPIEPDSLNIESSDDEVELTWNYDGEKADYFMIFRSITEGVELVDYYETINFEKFIDEDIDHGTKYYYRVAAVDDAGNIGLMSKEVNIVAKGEVEKVSTKKKLSVNLEIQLNDSIDDLKSDLFDFDLVIKKLERMTNNEEIKIIKSFGLLDDLRSSKNSLEDIISALDKLRDVDMDSLEFDSKIESFEFDAKELVKKSVKDVEILNSVDFQEISGEKEIKTAQDESRLRFDLTIEQISNFTKLSTKLHEDATIYTNIVSARIKYNDGSTKDRTLFSKNVETNNAENDIWIVETIPKSVASDASEIIFITKPKVLKSDPVVVWEKSSFKSEVFDYYIDRIVNLDDANLVRTTLLYNPEKFIPKDVPIEDNKVTGNSISDKLKFLSDFNWKELILPFIGIMVIIGLLVYYFVYLKEDNEHNLIIEEEKIKRNNQPVNTNNFNQEKINIMPTLNESKNVPISSYDYMVNLIKHANDHADNVNIDVAKKEYLLIHGLFNKVSFDDEHIKHDVVNKVRVIYNKLILWDKINVILKKGHSMDSSELESIHKNIETLKSIIESNGKTPLTNYIGDYNNYIHNIRGLKQNGNSETFIYK